MIALHTAEEGVPFLGQHYDYDLNVSHISLPHPPPSLSFSYLFSLCCKGALLLCLINKVAQIVRCFGGSTLKLRGNYLRMLKTCYKIWGLV